MAARPTAGTSSAPQPQKQPPQPQQRKRRRRAGRPYRRRRRKEPRINQLIKQALSARKQRGGLSLASLREALLANGYDVEKNRTHMRMAVRGLVRDGSQQQQQQPRGRRTGAAATTGCLRLGRKQKAEKKQQQGRRSPARSRPRAPPKKEPTSRKRGRSKSPAASRKRGRAAPRKTRARSTRSGK